jgi:4-amino-4-deoxy-L-arabinose transferase-like glycosyltransferase
VTSTATPATPRVAARPSRVERLVAVLWGSWPRRVIVLAVVVGFGLRCGWVIYAARTPKGLHDPFFYLDYSRRAVRGGGFYRLKDGEPTAYYPIGYPVVLTVWFWFMQHSPFPDHWIAAAAALNLLLSTASIALAGVLGRRLVGPWVGAIAAVIVALFPSLIFHSATILTETTFNFVFLCALVVLCWQPWSGRVPGWGRMVAFGLLLGASIQIRPIALLVLPMVLIALWRNAEWRRALARFAVVVGIVVAMMVPWTVRNEVVMHAFLPIGTTTGDNLCIGNFPGAQGHFAFPSWCFGHDLKVKRPRFETERNTRLTHQALQWATHHPVRELQLVWDRTRAEFLSDHDGLSAAQSYGDDPFIPPNTATTLSNIADWYFFAVLALSVVGLPLFLRGGDRRRLLVVLSIVAVVISVWPFFGDPRFHVPINVLIPLPAAMVLVALARRARRAGPRTAPDGGSGPASVAPSTPV